MPALGELLDELDEVKAERDFMERLFVATDRHDMTNIVGRRIDELSDQIHTLELDLMEHAEPDYSTQDRNAYHARVL